MIWLDGERVIWLEVLGCFIVGGLLSFLLGSFMLNFERDDNESDDSR